MKKFKLDPDCPETIREQLTQQGFDPLLGHYQFQHKLYQLWVFRLAGCLSRESLDAAVKVLEDKIQPKRTIKEVCEAWHVYEQGRYIGQCANKADAELLANQV